MILFIDTTQKTCNLAILDNNKIKKSCAIKTNNNLTDLVVEEIEKILKESKIKKDDINKIYLVVGPGSFTGVRVGVVIAQTWSLINKINIYVIDSLQLQISGIGDEVSLIDARGSSYYVGIYKNNKKIKDYKIFPNTIINEFKNKKVFIDYKNIDIFKNLLVHLKDFKLIKNSLLKPLYIKEPV